MNIPEKIFLEKCKSLIEEKLSWVESSNWKQRDFENLSELIFDKTQILLSLSTLKRIWKNNSASIPHPGTLNALAQFLEYKNWLEFKQSIADELNRYNDNQKVVEDKFSMQPIVSGQKSSKKSIFKRPLVITLIISFVGMVIVIFSINYSSEVNYDSVEFKSKTVITNGVPNTVIFNYDISQLDFDSAFIQQSWNPMYRDRIEKNNNQLTSIYYYPGLHKAKLIVDDKIVKEHNLLVKSDDWLTVARYSFEDEIPIYIPKEKTISGGRIYVSPETLTANNVNVSERNFLISYYNVRDFKTLDGDNFVLETIVKNQLSEGGLTCQYLFLTIMCENGRIVLPLSMAGCVANLYIKFLEKWIHGRDNDLSLFGCNMEMWNELKLTIKNKHAVIELNGNEILETNYITPSGKIIGLCYSFYGCGSVDNVTLSDISGKTVYSEDFSINQPK